MLNAIYVALSICIIYAIKKIMHIRRVAKTDVQLIKHAMRSKCEGHICCNDLILSAVHNDSTEGRQSAAKAERDIQRQSTVCSKTFSII